MRLRRSMGVVGCLFMLAVMFPCFAQTSSGPATLESLVNAGEAKETPAAESGTAKTGPKRPAGTVARPKDGVQHPDLDKAWGEYEATLMKASEGITASIAKQFDAATAKGDLNAAQQWQVIGEKFAKTGELPTESDAKSVSVAVADLKKAKEKLAKAYESVVKDLTMEKKIAEATAVRGESLAIANNPRPAPKPQPVLPKPVFLSDLQALNVFVGHGAFGTNGNLGFLGRQIMVQGVKSPKGLSMHPPANGASRAVYQIPKGFTHFEASVAIDDSAAVQPTAVTFKVFGDNRPKPLWESKPLRGAGQSQECVIEVAGVKTLTLIVECPGPLQNAHAVWFDPHLVVK